MRTSIKHDERGLATEIGIFWDFVDVDEVSKSGPALTDSEISRILEELTYDAEYGVDWEAIRYGIKMTLRERKTCNPYKGLE
tara:strand:+ start:2593 stop:2838 length:246 start_codon:yes stop_codon:yes gene_type:complete